MSTEMCANIQDAYIIAMEIMCTSAGSRSVASSRHAGKVGPKKSPIRLAETAFSRLELMNQMRICIARARPGAGQDGI